MDITLQKSGSGPVSEGSRPDNGLKEDGRRKRGLRWMWLAMAGGATVLLNQYFSMGRCNTRPTYDVVMVATKGTESGEATAQLLTFLTLENKGFVRLQLMG